LNIVTEKVLPQDFCLLGSASLLTGTGEMWYRTYEYVLVSTLSHQHCQICVTQILDAFLVNSIHCCISWWYSAIIKGFVYFGTDFGSLLKGPNLIHSCRQSAGTDIGNFLFLSSSSHLKLKYGCEMGPTILSEMTPFNLNCFQTSSDGLPTVHSQAAHGKWESSAPWLKAPSVTVCSSSVMLEGIWKPHMFICALQAIYQTVNQITFTLWTYTIIFNYFCSRLIVDYRGLVDWSIVDLTY